MMCVNTAATTSAIARQACVSATLPVHDASQPALDSHCGSCGVTCLGCDQDCQVSDPWLACTGLLPTGTAAAPGHLWSAACPAMGWVRGLPRRIRSGWP